jgi:hypothetical protein
MMRIIFLHITYNISNIWIMFTWTSSWFIFYNIENSHLTILFYFYCCCCCWLVMNFTFGLIFSFDFFKTLIKLWFGFWYPFRVFLSKFVYCWDSCLVGDLSCWGGRLNVVGLCSGLGLELAQSISCST